MFKPQMHHLVLFLLCGTITKPAFQQAEATITSLSQACNEICTGLAPVLCQSSCPVGNIDIRLPCQLASLKVQSGLIVDALISWTPLSISLQTPNSITFLVDIGIVKFNLIVIALGNPVSISYCVHIQLTIAVNVALATCVVTPVVVGTVTNLILTVGYTLELLGLTVANLIDFAVTQLALVLCSGTSIAVILNKIAQLLAFCPNNCPLI